LLNVKSLSILLSFKSDLSMKSTNRKRNKKYNLNRAKSIQKRRSSHLKRLRRWKSGFIAVYSERGKKEPTLKYERIKAPSIFSICKNFLEVIEFADRVKSLSKLKKNIFINISDIKELTADAIVVLISVLYDARLSKVKVIGNYPSNNTIKDKLEQSGFFKHVYGAINAKNSKTKNTIYTEFSNMVLPEFADEVVQEASRTVFGDSRGNEDIYRVLTELMMNTHKHANPKVEAAEKWWLATEHDEKNNKVSFAFIDNGVGILESINKLAYKQGLRDKLAAVFKNNLEILQDIMLGKIKSRTGLVFRGKGLPATLKAFERNGFSKLKIITNDVYADYENNIFSFIKPPFSGTLIMFEFNINNVA
jgi:hypothetical protein